MPDPRRLDDDSHELAKMSSSVQQAMADSTAVRALSRWRWPSPSGLHVRNILDGRFVSTSFTLRKVYIMLLLLAMTTAISRGRSVACEAFRKVSPSKVRGLPVLWRGVAAQAASAGIISSTEVHVEALPVGRLSGSRIDPNRYSYQPCGHSGEHGTPANLRKTRSTTQP